MAENKNSLKIWNLLTTAVILCTTICGSEGNACGIDECSSPTVYGGGTPTFTPASSCYSNEYYCPQPVSPGNGFEVEPLNEYVLYDVASFSCDDGFILGGAQSVMCTGSGEWYPSIPKCYEDCIIPNIANGYSDFAPGTSIDDQDQVNVSCDHSFTLRGVDMVTCRDGVWEPHIGHCFRKCSSPIIPNSDYSVNQGDIDHGEYVVVSCDSGYTFGSGTDYPYPLTCNNGTWDSSLMCYANCERPTFPDSMTITPEARVDQSHYHNDIITVTCAPNHVVTHGPPSATMSCDDGYWTPTMLPICKHINDT